MAAANKRWRLDLLVYTSFTLPFGFLPIGFLYLLRAKDGDYLSIPQLVTDGGILAIPISLSTDALSRLVASGKRWRELKVVWAAVTGLVIGCESFFYALRYARRVSNSSLVIDLCLLMLIVSIATGMFCRVLPEEES